MSCSYAKCAWEVRWRDSAGRQRSKRFTDEAAARAFDGAIRDHVTGERDKGRHGQAGGVYPYKTAGREALALCGAPLGWEHDQQARVL
jgi:hypothetical protein